MDSTDVKQASQRAGDHPALEMTARIGYAVNGVLHIIIGVIALALAFGARGASADQSGALGSMAENPLGVVVLWIAVVAWLGLGIWRRDERPAQGRGQGHRLPRPVLDRLPLRHR